LTISGAPGGGLDEGVAVLAAAAICGPGAIWLKALADKVRRTAATQEYLSTVVFTFL
jgi:hypothetical protein